MHIHERLYQSDLALLRDLCLGEEPGEDKATQMASLAAILDELIGRNHDVVVAFAPDDGE